MSFEPHLRVVNRGFVAFVAGIIRHMQHVIVPIQAGVAAITGAGQFEERGEAVWSHGEEHHVRSRCGAKAA